MSEEKEIEVRDRLDEPELTLLITNPVKINQWLRSKDDLLVSIQGGHVDFYVGDHTYSIDTFGIREWKNGCATFLRKFEEARNPQ